ncbi:hypothetical protein IAD21_05298 [Abditibacteriota bacterium]|nr:hypothetical protein IAD21_05298 [Abditibacteriota bacterium]
MVETALCVTFVLLPLTMGIVQYGVILSAMHQLDHFGREGARYASVHGGEANFDSSETTAGSLKAYLKSMIDGKSTILWADVSNNIVVTPAYGASTPRTSGQPITVAITYSMKKKFFLATFPGMGNLTQTYVARSTFVLE